MQPEWAIVVAGGRSQLAILPTTQVALIAGQATARLRPAAGAPA
jgi:hypothetical protein